MARTPKQPVQHGLHIHTGAYKMLQLVLKLGSHTAAAWAGMLKAIVQACWFFSAHTYPATCEHCGLQNSIVQLQLMHVRKPALALHVLQTAAEASATCTTGRDSASVTEGALVAVSH